jgi:RNA polymerase sigma-70 factor (ECF subfamily)
MTATALAMRFPRLTAGQAFSSDREGQGYLSYTTEAQFEDIYHHHHRKVYSICLRMLGTHEEAEDVTQEVFLQVFRKLHTFRGESTLGTWLHRVTVNAALMHLRRKRKWACETQTEDGDIESPRLPPRHTRSDGAAIDRLALKKAIAQLSPGCRTVFVLHDMEGYEHKEIADWLGISEGTSKSQLHDARVKLRILLG